MLARALKHQEPSVLAQALVDRLVSFLFSSPHAPCLFLLPVPTRHLASFGHSLACSEFFHRWFTRSADSTGKCCRGALRFHAGTENVNTLRCFRAVSGYHPAVLFMLFRRTVPNLFWGEVFCLLRDFKREGAGVIDSRGSDGSLGRGGRADVAELSADPLLVASQYHFNLVSKCVNS